MPLCRLLLPALLIGAASCCAGLLAAQGPDAGVEITLKADARADGPVIRIGHVAHLAGGDAKLRDALARLDVGEFPAGVDRLVLGRDEVKFRLLVAGHDAASFRTAGSLKCIVRKSSPAVTEEAILEAAQKAVLDRIPE